MRHSKFLRVNRTLKQAEIVILFMAGLIVITLLACQVYAGDLTETGDTRARPISCYGIQADGTVTAILVDSDGVVQTV